MKKGYLNRKLEMKKNDFKVYFNKPQQEVMFTSANTSVVVGGRRLGKSHGIMAPWLLRNAQRMPGCSVGLVASTYKRALMNTLPGTLQALESWGYKRGVHWFLGIKPPKSAAFGRPKIEPAEWEHVLSFYNGSIAYIISQDRPGTSNSMTLDAIGVDEAKFIDYEKLKDETIPANGGIKSFFGDKPYHHSMLIISDMPTTKKGSWFLQYEKKCDPELINLIQSTIYEIWQLKQRVTALISSGNEPPSWIKTKLRSLSLNLARMQRVAVLYKEYSSILNMEILGESYINQMKRDLTPLTFQTSILCKKIGILKDGFYSNMKEGHKYNATDNTYLDSLEYHFDKLEKESSLQDADVNRDAPIAIGMDYNSNINWIVAGQVDDKKLKVIKSFYVKYERKLPELVDDFCEYYRHHRCKQVIYYYDTTAVGSNYAVNNEDFLYVIRKAFERKGWRCKTVLIGNPMKHFEKYVLINRMFSGQARLIPYFNEQNNEDLLVSISTAGVRDGKKDKSGEKLMEGDDDLLQHRTDGSDAFDTLCIGCEKFPQNTLTFGIAGTFI